MAALPATREHESSADAASVARSGDGLQQSRFARLSSKPRQRAHGCDDQGGKILAAPPARILSLQTSVQCRTAAGLESRPNRSEFGRARPRPRSRGWSTAAGLFPAPPSPLKHPVFDTPTKTTAEVQDTRVPPTWEPADGVASPIPPSRANPKAPRSRTRCPSRAPRGRHLPSSPPSL